MKSSMVNEKSSMIYKKKSAGETSDSSVRSLPCINLFLLLIKLLL